MSSDGPIVVTGGAGFVGVNLADRLLQQGDDVIIYDNLSREGVVRNLGWLRGRHGSRVRHVAGDVRDGREIQSVIDGSAFVYHLAAQVAVTTSLGSPLVDHAINVAGTLNILEAIRHAADPPGLLFASTNKVYGALEDLAMRREARRYVPEDSTIRANGISEQRALDFISPYGCSKGAADQYVLDYCHSFGIEAVVFRMSCIYGPHQQANSDQGWVAHFLRSALLGAPLTIFGDGGQVRDILYIDDFVSALLAARHRLAVLSGTPFNIGGGVSNAISLLELIEMAEHLAGREIPFDFDAPRPGDQLYFAADHRRFGEATGWSPSTSAQEGIEQLWGWLLDETADEKEPALYEGVSLA